MARRLHTLQAPRPPQTSKQTQAAVQRRTAHTQLAAAGDQLTRQRAARSVTCTAKATRAVLAAPASANAATARMALATQLRHRARSPSSIASALATPTTAARPPLAPAAAGMPAELSPNAQPLEDSRRQRSLGLHGLSPADRSAWHAESVIGSVKNFNRFSGTAVASGR